ncbi:TetR-like C-terminal domain-containing protein [Actinophytocola glycyrrhizae]|uniref:TetR-like C-terminal domain-containing protein n=1 Tax=Actinophytocola glycyrrhizae TaxID=2044873 RepID=A0ABV9S614_9PSEU
MLTALSDEGFRRLAAALITARAAPPPPPPEALHALLTTYVHFAHDNPAYFRLMFRPELTQPHKSPSGEKAANEAFAVLADTVTDCIAEGTAKLVDADDLAITLWSLVHGLASLWLDGQLDFRADDPAALTERVVTLATSLTKP